MAVFALKNFGSVSSLISRTCLTKALVCSINYSKNRVKEFADSCSVVNRTDHQSFSAKFVCTVRNLKIFVTKLKTTTFASKKSAKFDFVPEKVMQVRFTPL